MFLNRKLTVVCLGLLSIVLSNISFAANNLQDTYAFTNVSEGLIGDSLRSIYMDPNGTVYLGSICSNNSGCDDDTKKSGLSIGVKQADGSYQFTNYTMADGLGSNQIVGVYVDKQDTIYVAAASEITYAGPKGGGLSIGHKGTDGRYHFVNYTTEDGLPENSVESVYVDDQGTVYAAANMPMSSKGGIAVGIKQADGTYKFTNYTMKDGLGSAFPASVVVDKKGTLYVANRSSSTGDDDGGLSIGTKQADGRYKFKTYTQSDGLLSNNDTSVFVDANGSVYVGAFGGWSQGGISIGTEQADGTYQFSNYTTADGLGGNEVGSVYADANGTVYVGSFCRDPYCEYPWGSRDYEGVSIGTKQANGRYQFNAYTKAYGLGSNNVGSVYATPDGTVYAATGGGADDFSFNGGLSIGKKVAHYYTFENYQDGLDSPVIYGIQAGPNNEIYAATARGVVIATPEGDGKYSFKTYTYNDGLGSNKVFALSSDSANTLYAATANGVSVGREDKFGSYTFINYTQNLGSVLVSDVVSDTQGNLYAATNYGVSVGLKQPDETYIFKNFTAGLGNPKVWGVFVDANDVIYAGTADGVSIGKFNNDNISFKNYTQGLANNNVNGVYVDKQGTLYAATSGGLAVGKEQADGSYVFTTNYTTENGLGSNQVSAVYVDAEGTLYAATSNGVSVAFKASDDHYQFTNFTYRVGSPKVHGITTKQDGTIYAATDDGISIGTLR